MLFRSIVSVTTGFECVVGVGENSSMRYYAMFSLQTDPKFKQIQEHIIKTFVLNKMTLITSDKERK
jgi:hypothetical protein